MDSSEMARRVLGGDAAPMSYLVPATGVRGRPSIYAALVAEWHAKGRAVPERRDTWRDSSGATDGHAVTSWAVGRWSGLARALDVEPVEGEYGGATERVPAVVVPRGLPGPAVLWEWSSSNGRVRACAPPTAD
ncbi:hypothetical protein ACFYNL_01485 [Streptomyces sp. NPDC007808]|uniref:hypothetical protein n=1 Tax=Streptomyces sp. NPDC007808 TaxID=3364779 RepID=UPI00369659D3